MALRSAAANQTCSETVRMAEALVPTASDADPSRLLLDEPAASDEIGSHLPIAETLAKIIETGPGGQAIALTGSYGSGKSTVIKLLRKQLESDGGLGKIKVFVFDAWAHQGDPLRRSFLQELYSFLVQQRWAGEGDFNRELEELSKRHETSTATPHAVIKWPGIAVLASLPVAAISTAWLDKVWWASFGVLAPVIIAGVYIAITTAASKKRGIDPETVYELFRTKPRDVVHMATVKNPDPTSVEFRKYFDDAAETVLESKSEKGRRLVIVLDNLDRLQPEDAMALFATMRTFFDPSSPDTPRERALERKLWLIVPFDSAWLTQIAGGEKPVVRGGQKGEAFLEKSFQVRIDVPDPILASKHSYMTHQLSLALPRHSDLYEKIFILYDRGVQDPSRSTPRGIKQFINRLVVSHMLRGDVVPLVTQAQYLLIEDPSSLIEKLRTKTLLSETAAAFLEDRDWERNFAALYYGLPPEDAQHPLLFAPILNALETGDSGKLEALAKVAGFSDVCQRVVLENAPVWASTAATLASACFGLDSVGAIGVGLIPSALRGAVRLVSSWDLDTANQLAGIIAFLETLDDDQKRDAARDIIRSIPAASGVSALTRGIRQWQIFALPFVLWAREYVGDDEIRTILPRADSEPSYLALLDLAGKNESLQGLIPLLLPSGDPSAVLLALVDVFRSDVTDANATFDLRRLARVPLDWPYEVLVNELVADLQSGNAYTRERTARYLDALGFLVFGISSDAADAALQNLGANGFLLHNMASLGVESEEFGRAMVLYWLYGTNTEVGNGSTALSAINQMAAAPLEDKYSKVLAGAVSAIESYDIFARVFETLKSRGAYRDMARLLFDEVRRRDGISPEQSTLLIANYDILVEKRPPAERSALVAEAAADPEFERTLARNGYEPGRLPLYVDLVSAQGHELSRELGDLLVDGTLAISEPKWLAELNAFGSTIQLVIALVGRGRRPWLEDAFRNALDGLCRQQLSGKPAPAQLETEMTHLLKSLENSRLLWFLRNVADQMEHSSVLRQVIMCYGGALLEHGILSDNSDRAGRCAMHTLAPLFRADPVDEVSVKWALEVIGTGGFAGILPDDVAQGIAREIHNLAARETTSDELRELIGIASQFLPDVSSVQSEGDGENA
jgi:Cdc6-like AAA superfamily ATPase